MPLSRFKDPENVKARWKDRRERYETQRDTKGIRTTTPITPEEIKYAKELDPNADQAVWAEHYPSDLARAWPKV
jgi:hypothetical protein